LTLIEAEVIESLRNELGLALDAGALRRNVVTRGVRLNGLVGVRFRIGPLLVFGTRLCEPCEYLVKVVGAPILAPLVHRGGLRVDVLTSGELVEGAEICLEQPTDLAQLVFDSDNRTNDTHTDRTVPTEHDEVLARLKRLSDDLDAVKKSAEVVAKEAQQAQETADATKRAVTLHHSPRDTTTKRRFGNDR
jgi:MOSC domain-containing protein YiiM